MAWKVLESTTIKCRSKDDGSVRYVRAIGDRGGGKRIALWMQDSGGGKGWAVEETHGREAEESKG